MISSARSFALVALLCCSALAQLSISPSTGPVGGGNTITIYGGTWVPASNYTVTYSAATSFTRPCVISGDVLVCHTVGATTLDPDTVLSLDVKENGASVGTIANAFTVKTNILPGSWRASPVAARFDKATTVTVSINALSYTFQTHVNYTCIWDITRFTTANPSQVIWPNVGSSPVTLTGNTTGTCVTPVFSQIFADADNIPVDINMYVVGTDGFSTFVQGSHNTFGFTWEEITNFAPTLMSTLGTRNITITGSNFRSTAGSVPLAIYCYFGAATANVPFSTAIVVSSTEIVCPGVGVPSLSGVTPILVSLDKGDFNYHWIGLFDVTLITAAVTSFLPISAPANLPLPITFAGTFDPEAKYSAKFGSEARVECAVNSSVAISCPSPIVSAPLNYVTISINEYALRVGDVQGWEWTAAVILPPIDGEDDDSAASVTGVPSIAATLLAALVARLLL